MPTYNYECTCEKCSEKFKTIGVFKKMSEMDRVELCKVCNTPMSRTVSSLICGMSVDTTNSFYRSKN